MKIITILGTRPEIIRLSRIIEKLDQLCNHILVDTNQNYEFSLSRLFFEQLKIRKPNYSLGAKGNFAIQVGQILGGVQEIFTKEKPDALLILGDTNSGLSAIVAKRMQLPVFHMEAGNRCFDDRVPEEINRRLIDHSSTILLPYTSGSRQNLLHEGIPSERILVTGNPIWEVITYHWDSIESNDVLSRFRLKSKGFFLVTLHRAENVDDQGRLRSLMEGLELLYKKFKLPIICSLHPRTREKLRTFRIRVKKETVIFVKPLSFFDFVTLEKEALCVLSDSGTVQEECCLLQTHTVTLRDVTERPETLECGSNILGGANPHHILKCVEVAIISTAWSPPTEYLRKNVSKTIINIVLGFNRYSAVS